jgi:hypothetical protein
MMNDSTRTAAADSEPGKVQAITGDPRVDEALAKLAALGDLPGGGHVEAYEHVYQRLHGMLDDLDTVAPGAAARGSAAAPEPTDHPVPSAHASHDHPDGQAEQA